eukprot:Rhum_TRINITY_DN14427_c6_g1::Rhum_TRINITY_DN14427_c6_g1_i1::g.89795::m.89795
MRRVRQPFVVLVTVVPQQLLCPLLVVLHHVCLHNPADTLVEARSLLLSSRLGGGSGRRRLRSLDAGRRGRRTVRGGRSGGGSGRRRSCGGLPPEVAQLLPVAVFLHRHARPAVPLRPLQRRRCLPLPLHVIVVPPVLVLDRLPRHPLRELQRRLRRGRLRALPRRAHLQLPQTQRERLARRRPQRRLRLRQLRPAAHLFLLLRLEELREEGDLDALPPADLLAHLVREPVRHPQRHPHLSHRVLAPLEHDPALLLQLLQPRPAQRLLLAQPRHAARPRRRRVQRAQVARERVPPRRLRLLHASARARLAVRG